MLPIYLLYPKCINTHHMHKHSPPNAMMFNSYLLSRIPFAWGRRQIQQYTVLHSSSRDFMMTVQSSHFIHSYYAKCILIESYSSEFDHMIYSPLQHSSSNVRWALEPMIAISHWQSPGHCTTNGIFDLSTPLTTENWNNKIQNVS